MLIELAMLSILIVVQTIFLLAAFWIMIKLQKLEYNFPGLLASAALIGTLDEILNMFIGHYLGVFLSSSITTPIVVAVSYLCIAKVTGAELVDVFFTVIVGRALWFGMNLWLIGTLMGDLRPASAADNESPTVSEQRQAIAEGAPMERWTNQPAPPSAPQPSAQPVAQPTAQPTARPTAQSTVRPSAPSAPHPVPVVTAEPIKPSSTNSAGDIAGHFIIKGVMRNGSRSAVTIQYGTRTYVLFLGDSVMMQSDDGPVTVRFKELEDDTVVLGIKGEEVKQRFHAP
jgi:hypothetical protein